MTPIPEKPPPTDRREQASEERKRSADERWIVTQDVQKKPQDVHGKTILRHLPEVFASR